MAATTYLAAQYLTLPADITEIQPMWEDWALGDEYQCRVLLREGDKQWAAWMSISARDLAEHLFETESPNSR